MPKRYTTVVDRIELFDGCTFLGLGIVVLFSTLLVERYPWLDPERKTHTVSVLDILAGQPALIIR